MHFLTEYENSVLSKKKSIVLEASKQKRKRFKPGGGQNGVVIQTYVLTSVYFRDVISNGQSASAGGGGRGSGQPEKIVFHGIHLLRHKDRLKRSDVAACLRSPLIG